jgi:hypothetical protein
VDAVSLQPIGGGCQEGGDHGMWPARTAGGLRNEEGAHEEWVLVDFHDPWLVISVSAAHD